MILHIGNDEFVPLSSIVAVLDAHAHPELMEQALSMQKKGRDVRRAGAQEAKSLVIVAIGPRRMFFLSPISVQTLRKRVESGSA